MNSQDKKIKAEIINLGYCSEGIGKVLEGKFKDITVFIDNTAPGDIVEAEIISNKKTYLKAKLTSILEEGQSRVKSKCPLTKLCGGCQWQHINYETQLVTKALSVKDSLERIANINPLIITNTVSSPIPWNYRSKVQFPVSMTKSSKRLLVGYYKPRSHEIINIKYCPVQPEEFDHIINEIRDLNMTHQVHTYDERTHKGYLRHIVLRKSFFDNEILLTFVVNGHKIIPSLANLSRDLMKKYTNIVGVTVNYNKSQTNVIFGAKSVTLEGQPTIIEKIGNKKYQISDRSFFQINPMVAELMFNNIYNIIEPEKRRRLLDIYAGAGAISIYLSELFQDIVAIESDKAAYYDFKANIELNDIKNIKFINDKAVSALKQYNKNTKFDWIILDPPRGGCEKEVLDRCASFNCNNIIYVSCNPATLSRDIKILAGYGFMAELVQPFDMFCQTYHVETITVLRKNE